SGCEASELQPLQDATDEQSGKTRPDRLIRAVAQKRPRLHDRSAGPFHLWGGEFVVLRSSSRGRAGAVSGHAVHTSLCARHPPSMADDGPETAPALPRL